ncbi:MAG: pilus assembly protein PilN, partial [Gammaproteobacteria bacterium]|nr:pilus assembly protein PilN [Gammaproteobacteria bacterium]
MITDIKINLLPWREEVREEKKNEFLKILIAILILAGALVGGVDRYYNRAIDYQTSRNAFLQVEIQILEERIDEIKLLQQKRNELLSRMKVIQELQGNRPIIVRVFDELARQLSPRV